jgi:hypothetical protein
MDKILAFSKKSKNVSIHYAAGNYDFHMLRLQNFAYPFNFVKTWRLEDRDCGCTYEFVHGYQFDLIQQEPIMESLCCVMSDGTGSFESNIWGVVS